MKNFLYSLAYRIRVSFVIVFSHADLRGTYHGDEYKTDPDTCPKCQAKWGNGRRGPVAWTGTMKLFGFIPTNIWVWATRCDSCSHKWNWKYEVH